MDRRLEEAAVAVARGRRRSIEYSLGALCGFAGAAAFVHWSAGIALSLAVAGALEILLALGAAQTRRDRIATLARDSAAYRLPEVRRYGERCLEPGERARLARWLRDLTQLPDGVGSMCLAERLEAVRAELEWLASHLASPASVLKPSSVVACRRLLTHPAESGLYNWNVSEDELRLAVRRICVELGRSG